MSKQIKAQPMSRARRPARNVVLAGIGAASLLRKNVGKSLTEAAGIVGRLPEASSIMLEGISERSGAMIEEIGARGNAFRWEFARLARLVGREASAATSNALADVQLRLQPLLRKFDDTSILFGIKIGNVKPERKPAKHARKSAKPTAKRVGRQPRKAA